MEIVSVYVGLDYHDATIRVCVMRESGDVLLNRNVANDAGAVRELLRWSGGFVRAVALEACCGAADFATRLIELTQWTVRLAHPGAVNRLKQGPDKTDHTDAWHLANLLRVGYLPEVWLADETTRQLRRLVRFRAGLAGERKSVKLRILSLLREDRIKDSSANPWTKPWVKWLREVASNEQSRWVLDQELRRLEQLNQEVSAVDKRMEESTAEDSIVQLLKEQPGVGVITAVTMRAVIGRFDRFKTGKQLSRYCGVTPCNASSGKRQSDSGLVEAGNDILRPLLIQLAKRLPRHEPRWRELQSKMRTTKGANITSAAIANRWLRHLYYVMTKEKREHREQQIANASGQTC